MTTVTVDGIPFFVERHGRGPAVLLIHGLGGPGMWGRALPPIAARREVLLPHLPGFGDSPPPDRPLAAGDHARLLGLLLDAVNVQRVTVAGISYGGEIAALLASSRPQQAGTVILICPTGTHRYSALLRAPSIRRALRPLFRAALTNRRISDALSRRSFHAISSRPDGLVDRHLERLSLPGRLDALMCAVEDIWSRGDRLPAIVGELGAPVHVVWGADDRTIPVSELGAITGVRPGIRTTIIPECGHSVPLEKPEELAALIADADVAGGGQ